MSKILATISISYILVIMGMTTTFADVAAAGKNDFSITFDAAPTTDKIGYYIWGRYVMGSMPIQVSEKTIPVDKRNSATVFDISYSLNENIKITQVQLYLAGNSTMQSKVYVVHGGISRSGISLQVRATNTDTLRYAFLVFGKKY